MHRDNGGRHGVDDHDGNFKLSVSQSITPVDYTFSMHLELMRCLTLIVRVSTQHDIHTM